MPHTPGPWMLEACRDVRRDVDAQLPEWADFWIAGGPCDEVIAVTSGPVLVGSVEANGHLLAAAPDLLDALKAVDAQWASGNFARTAQLWGMVVAAIRKAEGRA